MKSAILFLVSLVAATFMSSLLPKERRKPFFAEAAGVMIFFAALTLYGCAGLPSDPAKPRNEGEQFSLRNQDPRVGLVVNNGTAPMNLYVYDQANRLVEQVYLSGAERYLVSASGQPYPQYWPR